jgi:hypothetical protein
VPIQDNLAVGLGMPLTLWLLEGPVSLVIINLAL